MVIGFESFREHFKGYEDCYVIIGGTACDILMGEANIDFRATRDVDLVMLIEHRFELFAEVFWKYVKAGGYRDSSDSIVRVGGGFKFVGNYAG